MKFSHTLSLNSNPEWLGYYIDYADLKKIINDLAVKKEQEKSYGDLTQIVTQKQHSREIFLSKLRKMVQVVRNFYYQKRNELDDELKRLQSTLNTVNDEESYNGSADVQEKEDGPQEDSNNSHSIEITPLLKAGKSQQQQKHGDNRNEETNKIKSASSLTAYDLENLQRDISYLYTQYHNLSIYVMLNYTAIKKILKKYDKNMSDNMKDEYLIELQSIMPFVVVDETDGKTMTIPELDKPINTLKEYFTIYCCNNNPREAARRMKLMEREIVTFQRHSIWLDVIEDQRKHEAAEAVSGAAMITPTAQAAISLSPGFVIEQMKSSAALIISIIVFCCLLVLPGIFDNDPVKRNALSMFAFVSILWATEGLPLFVTSMLVPFLSVILRLIVIDDKRLDAKLASKHVFSAMFSHVIMLLIGGFSIAAALSKHNVAKIIASSIMKQFGSGIRVVLLVNMAIATISSMWISNVAAPVLCYTLIAPILKATTIQKSKVQFGTKYLQSSDNDERLCRALVMGIALASNVGGMASPISSPQNLFAIEYTPIGWLSWFVVSIPLCVLLDVVIWLWLIYCFQLPSANSSAVSWAIKRTQQQQQNHQRNNSNDANTSMQPLTGGSNGGGGGEELTFRQWYVIIVSVGVVLLWCGSVGMSDVTGQMGVLGIIPFILFFGSGILSKDDLNNFLWTVVILAMGGLVLGEAIKTSGLLTVIAEHIAWFIEVNNLNLWQTLCIFTILILFCTTFVSHTVGAIVILPIAYAVGYQMEPQQHSKELVFAGALCCSAAMGLPVSGFPNMTAVGIEDKLGNRFLSTKDFINIALPASIFSWVIIVTIGYFLILQAVKIDDL